MRPWQFIKVASSFAVTAFSAPHGIRSSRRFSKGFSLTADTPVQKLDKAVKVYQGFSPCIDRRHLTAFHPAPECVLWYARFLCGFRNGAHFGQRIFDFGLHKNSPFKLAFPPPLWYNRKRKNVVFFFQALSLLTVECSRAFSGFFVFSL